MNIATTPELEQLIDAGAPVAFGVSGGKDGAIGAIETNLWLDARAHTGARILIHSDLGKVEHSASLKMCELLARRLSLELVVVRRELGGMLERWYQRWEDNCTRYANLETVTLVLPWSTPSMRFCTGELKTAVICRELVRRWPNQTIVSEIGLRGEESRKRDQTPIFAPQPLLKRKKAGTTGFTWLPIKHWKLDDIVAAHQRHGFPWHPHYTVYGATRVSCAFCILASEHDLLASTRNPEHHDLYREMVDLEIASTFAFQSTRWLGDLQPSILTDEQREQLAEAKERAQRRLEAEALIPKHLRYDKKGWPTCIPTPSEAERLAEARRTIGRVIGLPIAYTDAESVLGRFEELFKARSAPPPEGRMIQTALF